jgi:hypothetical protein
MAIPTKPIRYDTLVLGAGAAGMFCAIHAAGGGASVLVVDHAKAPGEKIRISGGGRCNFTNLHTSAENFISANPHFAKSALKRYTQFDFIELVDSHAIAHHEKTLGQLFCDVSAKQIITMLTDEMAKAGAELWLTTQIENVRRSGDNFQIELRRDGRPVTVECTNLVIATGGKSIPKMGATGFGYRVAEQFSVPVLETRPALVPLTFSPDFLERTKSLAGVAVDAVVTTGQTAFREGFLFTHRGISGPSVLQVSSYWREGDSIDVSLLPGMSLFDEMKKIRSSRGKQGFTQALANLLPKRVSEFLAGSISGKLADMSDDTLAEACARIENWVLTPAGTEGYRTAEVTLGGVDTAALSSRTMECSNVPGLYFIGEVVDVTGWLGGYNFQWAWSSGWAAGTAIAEKGM